MSFRPLAGQKLFPVEDIYRHAIVSGFRPLAGQKSSFGVCVEEMRDSRPLAGQTLFQNEFNAYLDEVRKGFRPLAGQKLFHESISRLAGRVRFPSPCGAKVVSWEFWVVNMTTNLFPSPCGAKVVSG